MGVPAHFSSFFCSKTPKSMVFIDRNSNQQIQFLELILGLLTGPCLGLRYMVISSPLCGYGYMEKVKKAFKFYNDHMHKSFGHYHG